MSRVFRISRLIVPWIWIACAPGGSNDGQTSSSSGGGGLAFGELARSLATAFPVMDSTHVYFFRAADPQQGELDVVRVPKAGGDETNIARTVSVPGWGTPALAVDGTHVYFGSPRSGGKLWRAPKDGGEPQNLNVTSEWQGGPMLIDDSHVYFPPMHRVAKTGGPVELASEHIVSLLAVDDDYLYGPARAERPTDLLRVPKSGGEPTVLTRLQHYVSAAAVDGDVVFMIEVVDPVAATASVTTARVGDPEPTLLASSVGGWVSVDAMHVWFIGADPDTGTRALGRVPRDGGPAAMLNILDDELLALVGMDSTHIYYTTWTFSTQAHTLRRAEKRTP